MAPDHTKLPPVKRVDYYYDFSCPYAYLAHTQIEALCERAGAELIWRPMLLGGVFQAIGTPQIPASTMSMNKARLNALDMHRWADHFGVPLVMPQTHPNRTVLALRAALAAEDELPRASRALFRAYWALGLNVAEPDVVREALDHAGLDGAALVFRTDEPVLKEALRARTDEAIALGIFGAPSFIVTVPGVPSQLFWGQDRLDFVEKALGGWSAPSLLLSGGFSS
jgi:2-hydroxychromene-2-carboxylate isomerase